MPVLFAFILLWAVALPVALALTARYQVARTARARARASHAALWLLSMHFACLAALMIPVFLFDLGRGVDGPLGCCATALMAASPVVGVVVIYATEFAQRPSAPAACSACGYLRHGAAGPTCPECGEPWHS